MALALRLQRSSFKLLHLISRRQYSVEASGVPQPEESKLSAEHTKELQYVKNLDMLKKSIESAEKQNFVVPVFKRALLHGERVAIEDEMGGYSYYQLFASAKKLSYQLSNICGSASSQNVTLLCSNNVLQVLAIWGTWISGQVAMPLNSACAIEKLKYFVREGQMKMLVTTSDNEELARNLANHAKVPMLTLDHSFIIPHETYQQNKHRLLLTSDDENVVIEGTLSNDFYSDRNALLLCSSRSIGLDESHGIVLTHENLDSQIRCLLQAWQINESDNLLQLSSGVSHGHSILPQCCLSVGAKVNMQQEFSTHEIWRSLLCMLKSDPVSIFIAHPRHYQLLVESYDRVLEKDAREMEFVKDRIFKDKCLFLSYQAPLPRVLYRRWLKITGLEIQEFYERSEFGVALSSLNFVDDWPTSAPGTVGVPLPEICARLVDDKNQTLVLVEGKNLNRSDEVSNNKLPEDATVMGELQIAGPTVFKEYFKRQQEMEQTFEFDDFYKTGDWAVYENGNFKILGRLRDTIEVSGVKVSKLELETVLFIHPAIQDVVVVGLPDELCGEKIAVAAVLMPNATLDLVELQEFCIGKCMLPAVMQPMLLKVVEYIPRDVLGKVNGDELLDVFK